MIEQLLADITDCEKQASDLISRAKNQAVETVRLAKEQTDQLIIREKHAASAAARLLLEETSQKNSAWKKVQRQTGRTRLEATAAGAKERLKPASQFIVAQVKKCYGLAAD